MFPLALTTILLLAFGYLLGHHRSRARCHRLRADLAAARHLAEHDALTGLVNRAGAQRYYEAQAASGVAVAAVLIDLDGFKGVNDTWGHEVGDAQLVAIARRLAEATAAIGAVAGRLAGDEFLLLMPDPDTALVHGQVAAILAQLGAPLTLVAADALLIDLTPRASAGIALPHPDRTWAGLLRRADIALYQAKAVGGHAVLHTSGMQHPRRA
ncbi:MAG: GGDEF domain-containing protein, partial [Catenulispora sp.]|nr:GGDEF domain-containing protein [Catenulispora sp.]